MEEKDLEKTPAAVALVPAAKPARRPASPAKRKANRRNARHSTGPKTPAGKARSAANACKHGLLSRAGGLVPGEDVGDFRAFEAALRADLAPAGELEALLVDRVVTSRWRLRRAVRVEMGIFSARIYAGLESKATREARLALDPWRDMPGDVEVRLDELEAIDADEEGEPTVDAEPKDREEKDPGREVRKAAAKACYEALARREDAANAVHKESALTGRAYIGDAANADVFSKLSRYETTLERSSNACKPSAPASASRLL